MDEAISREQAIDAVNCVTVMKGIRSGKSVTAEAVDCAKRIIADNIRQLPPIQPETAKRIIGKSRGGMTLWYQCNVCNEPVDEKDAYCRGCGRRLIDE